MNQKQQINLVLASNSPRRKLLMTQIGLLVDEIVSPDIDEAQLSGELPEDYVVRISSAKARVVSSLRADSVVVAADTIIALDGKILGKPDSREKAFSMWREMSGRWHTVLSAVSVSCQSEIHTLVNHSDVCFTDISESSMEMYWATHEPCDKAGAYAIQGMAASWIKEIRGSYSGIMGLPLFETSVLLKNAGVRTLL